MHAVLTVMKKELLETLRDPMVLIMALGFPMLLFPMLIWGTTQMVMFSSGIAEQEPPRIHILGSQAPGPGGIVDTLSAQPAIVTAGDEADIQSGELDLIAIIELDEPRLSVELVHNSTLPRSTRALEWAEDRLTDVRSTRETELAQARGITPESLTVWSIESTDIAPAKNRMLSMLSEIMPMILVVMLLLATVSPAVDVFVGERERGTLETSLVTARSRWPLILGKILAASSIGMIGVAGNLFAGGITLVHTLQSMGVGTSSSFQLAPGAMLLCLLPLAASAILVAALTFLVIVPARTFKQAQSLSSWVIIGVLVAVYSGVGEEEAPEIWVALLPGRNLMHSLSDALRGVLSVDFALLTTGTNLAIAAAVTLAVHRIMGHEGYLFGPEDSGWRDALQSLMSKGQR